MQPTIAVVRLDRPRLPAGGRRSPIFVQHDRKGRRRPCPLAIGNWVLADVTPEQYPARNVDRGRPRDYVRVADRGGSHPPTDPPLDDPHLPPGRVGPDSEAGQSGNERRRSRPTTTTGLRGVPNAGKLVCDDPGNARRRSSAEAQRRSDAAADAGRGIGDHVIGKMSIARGRLRQRMAEQASDHRQGNAVGDRDRSEAVPKIVQPHVRERGLGDGSRPNADRA